MTIRPMGPADAAAAAALASARAIRARARHSLMPETWVDETAYRPLLGRIAEQGSGVVAVEDGRLVAYLAAWRGDGRDQRWTYTPEWAWGSRIGEEVAAAGRILQDLYAAAAERWTAEDRRVHYLGVFAGEPEESAFAWLGFGRSGMDAIRGIEPVLGTGKRAAVIRRAVVEDAAAVSQLEDGLRTHLAASPVFFALGPARSLDEQERRLADRDVATFLAEADGSAIGYLRIGPAADDASTVIRDPLTASISGAFTLPDRRRGGVATQLLAAAVEWARDAGHVRVAVDFETANLLASRFWTREFTPITFSLCRRI